MTRSVPRDFHLSPEKVPNEDSWQPDFRSNTRFEAERDGDVTHITCPVGICYQTWRSCTFRLPLDDTSAPTAPNAAWDHRFSAKAPEIRCAQVLPCRPYEVTTLATVQIEASSLTPRPPRSLKYGPIVATAAVSGRVAGPARAGTANARSGFSLILRRQPIARG